MRSSVFFGSVALFLAACQGCRGAKDLPPAPPPSPSKDSGVLPLDSKDSGLLDVTPESSSPSPLSPCLLALPGPGKAFCGGDGPMSLSLLPASPETKGKLFSFHFQVTQHAGLIVRHINGAKEKMKVVVAVTNDGFSSASFVLLQKGVSGPSTNLSELESLAVSRWSSSTVRASVIVPSGKSVRFDPSVEVGLQRGFATMGLYDYSFSQPHVLHVCFLGEREDWSVCPSL